MTHEREMNLIQTVKDNAAARIRETVAAAWPDSFAELCTYLAEQAGQERAMHAWTTTRAADPEESEQARERLAEEREAHWAHYEALRDALAAALGAAGAVRLVDAGEAIFEAREAEADLVDRMVMAEAAEELGELVIDGELD